jgi:hypothetical protein
MFVSRTSPLEAPAPAPASSAQLTKGHFFVNVAAPTYQTFRLPDPIDTVFAVELE